MPMRLTKGELRKIIYETVNQKKPVLVTRRMVRTLVRESVPKLPSYEDACLILSRAADAPEAATDEYEELLSLFGKYGLDRDNDDELRLMNQYVYDAARDDDDDQKEGRNTEYYVELAQDAMANLYDELGLPIPGASPLK